MENVTSKTATDYSIKLERLLFYMGHTYKKGLFDGSDIHSTVVILLKGFFKGFLQNSQKLYEIILKELCSLFTFLVDIHFKKVPPIPKPIEKTYFVKNFSETIRNKNSKSPKTSNLTCNCMTDLLDEMLEMYRSNIFF